MGLTPIFSSKNQEIYYRNREAKNHFNAKMAPILENISWPRNCLFVACREQASRLVSPGTKGGTG
jgi:hypothetical protein